MNSNVSCDMVKFVLNTKFYHIITFKNNERSPAH